MLCQIGKKSSNPITTNILSVDHSPFSKRLIVKTKIEHTAKNIVKLVKENNLFLNFSLSTVIFIAYLVLWVFNLYRIPIFAEAL